MSRARFPKDFTWGVSTSAYQIEGAAAEDGRGPCIWDIHCRIPGRVWTGANGDVACDHYHRWPEDLALMKRLGVDAYRFSVAWPRVLPEGAGAVNDAGLAFYDRLVDALLEAGITPWLCLYHWDLPQALHEQGGWTVRDVAGWYADYVTVVARRLGDRVTRFATFNEPNVSTLFGYGHKKWCAPGIEERDQYLRAVHHLNLAHGAGVDAVRAVVKDASIGIIHNRQIVHPEKDTPEDRQAAAVLDAHWNLVYADPQILGAYPAIVAEDFAPHVQPGDLERIRRPIDWFGMNHYGPIWAKADADTQLGFGWGDNPTPTPHPAIGWPIYPEAFTEELLLVHRRYGLPVVVTENGCGRNADEEKVEGGTVADPYRVAYLKLYTEAMAEAMRQGAEVRGYFLWSLLDAFEWGSGYTNRFGIVHVDFDTLARTPKQSFAWYKAFIQK